MQQSLQTINTTPHTTETCHSPSCWNPIPDPVCIHYQGRVPVPALLTPRLLFLKLSFLVTGYILFEFTLKLQTWFKISIIGATMLKKNNTFLLLTIVTISAKKQTAKNKWQKITPATMITDRIKSQYMLLTIGGDHNWWHIVCNTFTIFYSWRRWKFGQNLKPNNNYP